MTSAAHEKSANVLTITNLKFIWLIQIHVDIGNAEGSVICGSSCSRVGFLGYQAVFKVTIPILV